MAEAGLQKAPEDEKRGSSGESGLTILLALAMNVLIAAAKAIMALLTGSAALAAEAAHSVADTVNEVLLLTALRRSKRPADRRHPFGYGKERFFWSLLVAVTIFGCGALFAFIEGYERITGTAAESDTSPIASYVVLAVAFVLEGISLRQAYRQVRRSAVEHKLPWLRYLNRTDDPTVKTVLLEDAAALAGLVIAFLGLLAHQLTGSQLWDGIASVLIGVMLTAVAYSLGRANMALLVGSQADERMVGAIGRYLVGQPEVETVVDIVTMMTGTDQVLLCARLDFRDDLGAADLERACARFDDELRERFGDLDEIFLEPMPRTDAEVRARVLARYGTGLVNGAPDTIDC